MKVKELKKTLEQCKDDTDIVIYALTEDNQYRPFKNITSSVMNKTSFKEEVHLDISIHKEYQSIHFPNNPKKETIEELLDKKQILLEELEEINQELGEYWE